MLASRLADMSTASLSARRAWIEILTRKTFAYVSYVALRKESVDRNCYLDNIEITQAVALRKESVDRNRPVLVFLIFLFRRSPQGERG